MTIERTAWGLTDDRPVDLFMLTNAHGLAQESHSRELWQSGRRLTLSMPRSVVEPRPGICHLTAPRPLGENLMDNGPIVITIARRTE